VGRRLGVLILLVLLSGTALLMGTSLMSGESQHEPDPRPAEVRSPGSRVKVEVLNGSGISGVAWDATLALRDRGFDVVFYGNAGTFSEDPSVVSDRVGMPEAARDVASALGIPKVESAPDTSRLVDVSVRLGPEWEGPPAQEEGVNEPPPHWWDLRRFFRKDEEADLNPPSGL
jgi:hypothetical protein